MRSDAESEWIEKPPREVPKIQPTDHCNAKKTERNVEGQTTFAGYCNAKAGKGTDHLGEGRCKYHGGASTGAPKGNQNAQTHAMNADAHHYHQSLPPEEQEYIRNVSASICDRIQTNAGSVDYLDRVMARRIAIELHIVSKASDHVENVSDLTESLRSWQGNRAKKAALLGEIRKRDNAIFKMLKEIGVLDDPESQKKDALEAW